MNIDSKEIGQTTKNLYLDPSFTPEEVDIIIEATHEWEMSTGFRVIFNVLYEKPIILKARDIEIFKMDSNNSFVKQAESGHKDNLKHVVYGLCWKYHEPNPIIWIITDRINGNNKVLLLTVIHELGHSLGMEHSDNPNTILATYQNLNIEHLTYEDLKEYCKLHDCSVND